MSIFDRYELAENDPAYMALLNDYNDACERMDDEWVAAADAAMQKYGAWTDSAGYWRHPSDQDKRPLDELMGWKIRAADKHHD